MPKDYGDAHEDDYSPEAEEDAEHDTLRLQTSGVGVDKSTDKAIIVVSTPADGGGSNGLNSFVDGTLREHEGRVVHPGHINLEIVMQERQGILDSIDLASNETAEKFLSRLLEDSATENGIDSVLDVGIKLVNGAVQAGRSLVNPSKQPIIESSLSGVDPGVDLVSICRRLVVHAIIDRSCDCVAKVGHSGSSPILVLGNQRIHSPQLQLHA